MPVRWLLLYSIVHFSPDLIHAGNGVVEVGLVEEKFVNCGNRDAGMESMVLSSRQKV